MLTLIKLESTDALSGAHTGRHLGRILHWAGVHLSGESLDLLNFAIRKCGHCLGYSLLCFTWFVLLRGTYWLQHEYRRSLKGSIQIRRMWWRPTWAVLAVLFTFIIASADELHQMNIPSRTGSWEDVVLDTAAALACVWLIWARAYWRCRDSRA